MKKLDTEDMEIVIKAEDDVKKDITETEEEIKEQENINNSEQCNPESKAEKHIAEKEIDDKEANENTDCGTGKSTDENQNDPDNTEMQNNSVENEQKIVLS